MKSTFHNCKAAVVAVFHNQVQSGQPNVGAEIQLESSVLFLGTPAAFLVVEHSEQHPQVQQGHDDEPHQDWQKGRHKNIDNSEEDTFVWDNPLLTGLKLFLL